MSANTTAINETKTTITRRGNQFFVEDAASRQTFDALPRGTYTLHVDAFGGLYLVLVDTFSLPPRLYGNINRDVDRFLLTYEARDVSTGILLSGTKGSGKTLTARVLSRRAVDAGVIVILVNDDISGGDFNAFVQQIKQPCMFLFDEFEKTYRDKTKQQELLSLLDGVFPTRKLFVFTCNTTANLDENLFNRPGRIFYALQFKGLDDAFITDYCQANLEDQAKTESVINVARLFHEFNFDTLQAIVEEMNRYKETAAEVLHYLNAKPELRAFGNYFDAELLIDGRAIRLEDDGQSVYVDELFDREFTVSEYDDHPDDNDKKPPYHRFNPKDIVRVEPRSGLIVFVQGNKRLTLRERRAQSYDYRRYLDGPAPTLR